MTLVKSRKAQEKNLFLALAFWEQYGARGYWPANQQLLGHLYAVGFTDREVNAFRRNGQSDDIGGIEIRESVRAEIAHEVLGDHPGFQYFVGARSRGLEVKFPSSKVWEMASHLLRRREVNALLRVEPALPGLMAFIRLNVDHSAELEDLEILSNGANDAIAHALFAINDARFHET